MPLSFSQQRLWLFEQMVPGTAVYNLPAVVRVTGPLEHVVLERCLDIAVERHAVLRTTFRMAGDGPVQVVRPYAPQELAVHDLTDVPPAEREAHAMLLVQREIERPFDLADGPPMRARLLRLAAEDHVLVLNTHHIAGDAWSWDVLLRELARTYRGEVLEPLPIQYSDFARWQRGRVEAGEFGGQLAYWRKYLADAVSVLELPTDRPRPARPSVRGGVVRFEIPVDVARAVRKLCRDEGATVFVATLAAFKILLHRYCRQADILVGTPVAGRGHPDVEPLVGFFVNTLLLRTVLNGRESFRDVLRGVQRSTVDGFTNQDIPLEMLRAEVRPARTDDVAPVFQVMFAYRPQHSPVNVGDLRFEYMTVHTGTAKRDLTLQLLDSGEAMDGQIEFSADLFDESTVERFAVRYQELLAAAAAAPGGPVADLPLLLPDEERLVAEANATGVRYPEEKLAIHELLERQAAMTGSAPAVRFRDGQLTYAELNQRSNQLAHRLMELGAGPEVTVGLCLGASLELVVAVFGILKAGAAYVPVDPDSPVVRRHGILRDAGARILVGSGDETGPWRTVELDSEWTTLDGNPTDDPAVRTEPATAAYVLYTSGSTGKPKGVVVEHRQVINYICAMLDRLELRQPLSYAMVQPLTVDSCLTMLIPPLCTGGVLHVVDKAMALDADALADYCRQHSVGCLKIAPAHLASLRASQRFAELLPRRRLIVGGEASNWAWLRGIQALVPGCHIHNHYGPTETTVGVLTLPIDGPPDDDLAVTPLGRAIPNTQAYVLDEKMRQVPFGVAGELYIGGANLARCYAGRPDLTALAFVPNPFADTHSARLYRTGDIVKIRNDGAIQFLGRADDQVKVRGFRVELGEIEGVLKAHPEVRDAVAAVHEDVPGDQRVVAYLVAADPTSPPVAAVNAFVRERLPAHMVPSAFVVLESIPLSPHGKVDRNALPAVVAVEREDRPFAEPLDGIERRVAEIWQRLLNIDRVGVEDNFFDLGGHSLLLVQLHQHLQDVLGGRFGLIELFRFTTVRTQARLLEPRPDAPTLAAGRQRGRKQSEQLKRLRRARQAIGTRDDRTSVDRGPTGDLGG